MLKDGEGFQWTCVGISCSGLHLALGCGVLQAERQRVPHLAMEPLLVVGGGIGQCRHWPCEFLGHDLPGTLNKVSPSFKMRTELVISFLQVLNMQM